MIFNLKNLSTNQELFITNHIDMKHLLNFLILFFSLMFNIAFGATIQDGEKYNDWVGRCETDGNSQICYIEQNLVSGKENKRRVLGVQLGYYQKNVYGNFILPLGVMLKDGVKIRVDGFDFSTPVPYTYCNEGGCSASFHLDQKMIEMLKKGKKMEVTAVSTNGQDFSLPVSLNGFTKAFGLLTSE